MTIKTMKVNSNAKLTHSEATRDYIVSVIDFDGTESEKLKFFFETFDSEYGWNVSRIGLQKALSDYLQGLPSTVNHEFENNKIIELLLKWEYITEKDIDSDKSRVQGKLDKELENYWGYIAMALIVMAKRKKVIS